MKKLICICVLLAGCSLFSMSRIIEQTDHSAIVNAIGSTRYEAQVCAYETARDILKSEVKDTQPPECNLMYEDNPMGGGGTFWSCNVFVEKR